MSQFIQVDSLTVRILVDNQTDPLSTTACTHITHTNEVPFIIEPQLPNEEVIKSFDRLCCAGHGYSVLLTATKDAKSHTILFDVGPTDFLFAHNSKCIQLDMDKVDGIVLSHSHTDHTGGLKEALKQRKSKAKLPIFLNPIGLCERGSRMNEKTVVSIGAIDDEETISKLNGDYQYNKEPKAIINGFFKISGEVPRVTEYEIGKKNHVSKIDGKWVKDELIMDEQFLMVDVKGKGIILFVGCSHFGIVNAIKYCKALNKDKKIFAIFGGFHLSGKHEETIIEQTVKDMKVLVPDAMIIPGHCTGWRAHQIIAREFGEKYMPSFVGHFYSF